MALIPIPLPLIPRDNYFIEPIFAGLWKKRRRSTSENNATENTENTVTVENDTSTRRRNSDVTLPWKWNNVAKFMEMFNISRPDSERSPEVQTLPTSYQIFLDVQHYHPEELAISLTGRTIVVKGKHDEREDHHGAVSRGFSRKFIIPSDCVMERIECNLSEDGMLYVTAPRKFKSMQDAVLKRSKRIAALNEELEAEIAKSNGSVSKSDNSDKDGSQVSLENEKIESTHDEESKPSPPEKNKTVRFELSDGNDYPQGHGNFGMVPFWSRERELPNSKFGVKSDKTCFKVVLDVGQYTQEELSVHTTPHHVLVEGNHQEKEEEHGTVVRNFTRKYFLPNDVNPDEVACHLTSDGVLEITAPRSKQHFHTLAHSEAAPVLVRVRILERALSIPEKPEMMNETTEHAKAIFKSEDNEKQIAHPY